MILNIVLYGCETWSISKTKEMAGGWRKLHNEELHKFYASPNIIRVMKSGGRGGRDM
jgi:hypothetical protein